MKWRLLAAFIGVTTVVLLAHDIPLVSHLRRVETERLLAATERDAFIIAGTAEDVLSGEDPSEAAALDATLALYRSRDGAGIVVTDTNGVAVAVADTSAAPGDDYSNRPEVVTALTGTPTSGSRHSSSLDTELVYVAVPVLSGAQTVGAVRITYPQSIVDERANEKVRGLLLVGVISLACAGVAALFVTGTLVRPLRRLQRSTEQLAHGDLSVRAATNEGPPEVRQLAGSFNEMTERLDELVEQQRSFAADASHQLRTPLTALRLQLERGAELLDTDPDAARTRIEAAGAEVERLQQLVEGLLLLARADRGQHELVSVDVAAVLRERAALWAALGQDHGVDVTAVAPAAPVHVLAVDGALEQIVDNLVDNSMKVSAAGTTIELSVVPNGTATAVCVVDQGPGMSAAQLEHARDRFWRGADAQHQGSGLGLAIVDHLVRASGGSLVLANRAEGGLVAEVQLSPAAAAISPAAAAISPAAAAISPAAAAISPAAAAVSATGGTTARAADPPASTTR